MREGKTDSQKEHFWKDRATVAELTAVAFGLVLVILTAVGLLNLR
jgi:hypothetical protein